MSTAAEARAVLLDEVQVPIVVRGKSIAFRCRYPDLETLVFRRALSLPMLSAALTLAERFKPSAMVIDERPDAADDPGASFLERWVCAAAIEPRVVLDQGDAGEDALHIRDLTIGAMWEIFRATSPEKPKAAPEVAAVALSFPGGSAPEIAGSGSTAVPDAALVPVGD